MLWFCWPGKQLPVWWPHHPGAGKLVTHVIRTLDEVWAIDMRQTPHDIYGSYDELRSGRSPVSKKEAKRAVMLHVCKVSEGTPPDKSCRPFLSTSSDAMSQETNGSSKVTHAKQWAMSQQDVRMKIDLVALYRAGLPTKLPTLVGSGARSCLVGGGGGLM